MGVVREMLRIANAKLGESIHHFDLPAVTTCPGRSSVCEQVCYATQGRYRTRVLRGRLEWNLRQTHRQDFLNRLVREIRRKGVLVLRLHVSGDFYSVEYLRKWLQVMRRLPNVRFYGYTRSWRVPEMTDSLAELAAQPNCRLWFSVDDETGLPGAIPEGVRLAYLQSDQSECLDDVDLVFRLKRLRRVSRFGLPLVCPNETPSGHSQGVNCGSCGHCFRD